ncbi:hypothetical protein EYC98_01605 [Halieaceae bacterium IMCC14734]|uniref:Alginate export domain-containing protein n=1 Tax=Candidatus Litorirhabdus singularis TaxID=2518993 RepID=A0ABT3TB93_9GAMM|nr:hypothetical protein [Candidatus Litorirhabdus singularis]MCX2979552.1 hypothetical protein [Candidatus Litorirhabdus singularis]
MRWTRLSLLMLLFVAAPSQADSVLEGGHTKLRLGVADIPDDSVFLNAIDSPAFDQGGDLRLNFKAQRGQWGVNADYQLIGQAGDSLTLVRDVSTLLPGPGGVQNDDRRLMDLTAVLSEGNDYVISHRLDRLALSWRGEKWVARVGRQAISWGNGLLYNPVDIFNPFDPAAVDKEYKSGDDMAYTQYLRDNGDDLQAVYVVRRDEQGDLDQAVNSTSVKYHGFSGDAEYDLLLAEHYDDMIVGIGGSLPLGGAVLRGDVTFTETDLDEYWSAVANLSYSWVGWGRNMSGVVEYFYNGFGQPEGEYSTEDLQSNPDLLLRLARGELFTLGRHYVAGTVLIEVTPLLTLAPTAFVNLADQSFLAQLVGTWSLSQNWQLLAALNLPVGGAGTEYGGIETAVEGQRLSQGASIFAQLAWYF